MSWPLTAIATATRSAGLASAPKSTNEEGHECVGGQTVRAGVVTYFLDEGAPERPERGGRDFRMRTGGDDLVDDHDSSLPAAVPLDGDATCLRSHSHYSNN